MIDEPRFGLLGRHGSRALSVVVLGLSVALLVLVTGGAYRPAYLPLSGALFVLSIVSAVDAAAAYRAIRRRQRELDAEMRVSVAALEEARRRVRAIEKDQAKPADKLP